MSWSSGRRTESATRRDFIVGLRLQNCLFPLQRFHKRLSEIYRWLCVCAPVCVCVLHSCNIDLLHWSTKPRATTLVIKTSFSAEKYPVCKQSHGNRGTLSRSPLTLWAPTCKKKKSWHTHTQFIHAEQWAYSVLVPILSSAWIWPRNTATGTNRPLSK